MPTEPENDAPVEAEDKASPPPPPLRACVEIDDLPPDLQELFKLLLQHRVELEGQARRFASGYGIPLDMQGPYINSVTGELYEVGSDEYNAFRHAYSSANLVVEIAALIQAKNDKANDPIPEVSERTLKILMDNPALMMRLAMYLGHANEGMEYWNGGQHTEEDLEADLYNNSVGFQIGAYYVSRAIEDGTLSSTLCDPGYHREIADLVFAVYSEDACLEGGLHNLRLIKDSENPQGMHYDKHLDEKILYAVFEKLDDAHATLNTVDAEIQKIRDEAEHWIEQIEQLYPDSILPAPITPTPGDQGLPRSEIREALRS